MPIVIILQVPNGARLTVGSVEGILPSDAQHKLQPLPPAGCGAGTLFQAGAAAAVPQLFHEYKAAAAAAGIKVCENCGTTTTPLWRKDKQTGMMMCNVSEAVAAFAQGATCIC